MSPPKRHRGAIIGTGLAVLLLGFLAFRADKSFVDDVVDEPLAEAFGVAVSVDPPGRGATTTPPPPTLVGDVSEAQGTPGPASEPELAGPVPVSAGAFHGINHSAAGTATVHQQDGRYVLRFEDDTDIQNGPDLYVWVLPSTDYDESTFDRQIDLGKIKGNVGGQNYELPDDFDRAVHRAVLVWWLRFGVPFAAAPLS